MEERDTFLRERLEIKAFDDRQKIEIRQLKDIND